MKEKYATPRSFLAALAAIALTLALTPLAAHASGNVKAIQLGTGGLVGPEEKADANGKYYEPGSYVWFGANGAAAKPIKWRVLDAAKANDGTTDGAFLLSEYLLAEGVCFDANSNVYQESDGQEWCKTFASNTSNFSEAEQGAMLGVAKKDGNEDSLYGPSWAKSELTSDDKLFFLSVRELADKVCNYTPAEEFKAYFDDGPVRAGAWWLRSPYGTTFLPFAGFVLGVGDVDFGDVDSDLAVRPAFNLDLGSVLFTSAAVGGKVSNATGPGALEKVGTNTGDEWKLTLLDTTNHSGFTAALNGSSTVQAGSDLKLNYNGARTGATEYVSAVVEDNMKNILYYGHLAQSSAAGTAVELTIPAELTPGDYILKVFAEQCNGDRKTDYASALKEIDLTVTAKPTGITLDKDSLSLKPAETAKLIATVEPAGASGTVTWESTNEGVAVVSGGTVIGTGPGTAVVKAKVGVLEAICVVTVTEAPDPGPTPGPVVTGITLDKDSLSLKPAETGELIATVEPAGASGTPEWTSSNEGVAVVSNGTVFGMAPGQAVIKAKLGGHEDACLVTVTGDATPSLTPGPAPKGVALDRASLSLKPGETGKLTATVEPAGASGTVEWTSSNESVAVVSNGTVFGMAPGLTIIKAKIGGHEDVCLVMVGSGGTPAPGSIEATLVSGGGGEPRLILLVGSDGAPVVWTPLRVWLELLSLKAAGVRASAAPGEIFGPFVAVTDGSGLMTLDVDALVWAEGEERGKKASVPAGTYRIRLSGASGGYADSVAGPIVILAATQGGGEGNGNGTSGSGGCDMGLGGLAMMACAVVALRRR